MNPANSITGTTYQFNNAPPVKIKSVRFIAISILIMEIKLIPNAVLTAFFNLKFCFIKTIVSREILVSKPFIIAKIIIPKIEKPISVI